MSETTKGEQAQIQKQDRAGRVRVTRERRESLLEEYDRSGMSGVEFAGWAGVKYPTFAGWLEKATGTGKWKLTGLLCWAREVGMRMRRIKMPAAEGAAVYHCVTRTVNGEFLLDERAKEVLRKQLRQAERFCGVELLTFCILDNHFHVLVKVPQIPPSLSDVQLLARYRALYPKPTKFQQASLAVIAERLQSGGPEAETLRSQLLSRMNDVSQFMKIVKQRFSVWFNRSHNRYGTLWAERFKSVLVENTPKALETVAAYIDLNPVRAGLVEEPADYRWCGSIRGWPTNRPDLE